MLFKISSEDSHRENFHRGFFPHHHHPHYHPSEPTDGDDSDEKLEEKQIDTKGYNYIHPESWPVNFPMCRGTRQSPINIQLKYMKPAKFNTPLKWFHYENYPTSANITNNGHSGEN